MTNCRPLLRAAGVVWGISLSVWAQPAAETAPDIHTMVPQIHEEDVRRHVYYLASDALQGRLTGTPGETLATEYVAKAFEGLGLKPGGDDGTFFQAFEFAAGVSLGPTNTLNVGDAAVPVDTDWRPLAFSKSGSAEAGVAFAGYGIVAPADKELPEYDSYVHLDVKDKWVLVFRFIPENVPTDRRMHLNQFAGLRYKAMVARDRGAIGLIVVTGPNAQAKDPLVALSFDASIAGSSIAGLSVNDSVAEAILKPTGKTVKELQDGLDNGEPSIGFPIPDVTVKATIDIQQEKRTGRNVLARLDPPSGPTDSVVLVGAHVDHLGANASTGSLARDDERNQIHHGADDNASGVAGMLEIAQWFAQGDAAAQPCKHSIVFAAWSGEELGLLGSAYYTRKLTESLHTDKLSPAISAYVNMDMIGRMRDNVVIGGVGSSSIWLDEIRIQNQDLHAPIVTQDDSYLPTDATSFFVKGIPFLNAFTGAHEDYHTPRDTADKINCAGAAQIAKFLANVTRSLANRDAAPDYIGQAKPKGSETNTGLRAYLGTIPDYGQTGVTGLPLSGVAEKGPAANAGLKSGDVIVELGGKKVENIYDYTYAIEALKIGASVKIIVMRAGERIEMEITPTPRE